MNLNRKCVVFSEIAEFSSVKLFHYTAFTLQCVCMYVHVSVRKCCGMLFSPVSESESYAVVDLNLLNRIRVRRFTATVSLHAYV